MKHFIAVCCSLLLVAPALADPPDHAPTRGYRNKEKNKYRGYAGVEWEADYGISCGRCDTDKILTVVGAVGGDAIDDGDRASLGHSLEVGSVGHAVTWTNPHSRIAYRVEPVRDLPGGCREFRYRAGSDGRSTLMTACRRPDATWAVRR